MVQQAITVKKEKLIKTEHEKAKIKLPGLSFKCARDEAGVLIGVAV